MTPLLIGDKMIVKKNVKGSASTNAKVGGKFVRLEMQDSFYAGKTLKTYQGMKVETMKDGTKVLHCKPELVKWFLKFNQAVKEIS